MIEDKKGTSNAAGRLNPVCSLLQGKLQVGLKPFPIAAAGCHQGRVIQLDLALQRQRAPAMHNILQQGQGSSGTS